jgi:HAD superfamily hydrolase (TIGR01458 family)
MASSLLSRAAGLLIDLDGTVYQEGSLIPGAGETLAWLSAEGIPFRFVTNTTMRSRASLAQRLQRMGVDATEADILNPATVTARFLRTEAAPAHVLVLDDALHDFEGVILDEQHPKYVVVGDLGDGWTFDILNRAFRLVFEQGAVLIALGRSRYWRASDGLRLDSGPFVAALEYATGQTATVMGKPERAFFAQAIAALGLPADLVAMIGDDIDGDVAGAQRAGLIGALVQTGKFRPDDLTRGTWPDFVLGSLAELRS